jgi:hypothetical protein
MWGVLSISHFGSRFTKNPISELGKWKKQFCGTKQKSASMAFLTIPRATHVLDMASFR